MLTSLAKSKAMHQWEALMLKFCPYFVCISSMKMGKWFRIIKRTVFILLGLFKEIHWALNADFRILNQRLFIFYISDWYFRANTTKQKNEIYSTYLLVLPLIFLFSFCKKTKESLNLLAFFTHKVLSFSACLFSVEVDDLITNNYSHSTLSYLFRDFCLYIYFDFPASQ